MLRFFLLVALFVCVCQGALDSKYVKRTGSAPTTHSCENVRAVPQDIVSLLNLDTSFYAQYTEAYGIPILSSAKCSKEALTRACYVMRYLFAGKQEYRDNIFQAAKYITIMAKTEVMTDVPEQKDWPKSYNSRYRGMSATLDTTHPTTGAEENLVCDCKNGDPKYWLEDYFLHEAAHTLHLIGVNPSLPTFEQELIDAQAAAKASGKWGDVYGMRDDVANPWHEYFAEAVQSYFGNNMWFATPNGWHGPINSAKQVEEIDQTIVSLIKKVIPCSENMKYISRCEDALSGFKDGVAQKMKMDETCTEETTTNSPPSYTFNANCKDGSTTSYCNILKSIGYCDPTQNKVAPGTMAKCCGCACNCAGCQANGQCGFIDTNTSGCPWWAKNGECANNPYWMNKNCAKSCMALSNPNCN